MHPYQICKKNEKIRSGSPTCSKIEKIRFFCEKLAEYAYTLSNFISNINILAELKRLRQAGRVIERYLIRNKIISDRPQFDSCDPEIDKRLKANIKQQVFKSLVDSHEVDLPKSLVDIEIRQLAETTLKNLEREGADMKDIKLEPSMFEERAKVSCKLRLLLGNIVELNSLESTEEQTQTKIQEFAMNYDEPSQAVKWFNEDPTRLQEPKALATEDNVVTWFTGQCKTEKKAIDFDNVISAQFDE